MKTFGERVREARKARGWSLERCATKARMGKSFCSEIETGKRRAPDPAITRRLCKALGLPAAEMIALAFWEKRPKELSPGQLLRLLEDVVTAEQLTEPRSPKLLKAQGITLLSPHRPPGKGAVR